MLKNTSISAAARAGERLKRAARRADANRDDSLTTAEIRGASALNGPALTKSLLGHHSSFRASVRRDPELAGEPTTLMPVVLVDMRVESGVAELRKIDSYQGTRRPARAPNTPDGVVTDAEVKNYHFTGGRMQRNAWPLANLTWALDP